MAAPLTHFRQLLPTAQPSRYMQPATLKPVTESSSDDTKPPKATKPDLYTFLSGSHATSTADSTGWPSPWAGSRNTYVEAPTCPSAPEACKNQQPCCENATDSSSLAQGAMAMNIRLNGPACASMQMKPQRNTARTHSAREHYPLPHREQPL